MPNYGWMTHSFLNSTEHRQMKRERKEATEHYAQRPVVEVEIDPACPCGALPYPHIHTAEEWMRARRQFARDLGREI